MPRSFKKFFATGDHPCYFCGKMITMRGRTRMSLIRHHLNHDSTDHREENIVPVHRLCHELHHKVGKPKTEREIQLLRESQTRKMSDPAYRERVASKLRGRKLPEHVGRAVAESNRRRAERKDG
jgi:hypothetical protein